MAIQKNAGGGGNFVKEPGEYRVTISKIETGKSKTSQQKMLTVHFQTADEKKIAGYFVQTLKFHMAALEQLKIACGLKVTDSADGLVDKECGILVEAQEPSENGRVFMQIVGYGPAADVTGQFNQSTPESDSNVPF